MEGSPSAAAAAAAAPDVASLLLLVQDLKGKVDRLTSANAESTGPLTTSVASEPAPLVAPYVLPTSVGPNPHGLAGDQREARFNFSEADKPSLDSTGLLDSSKAITCLKILLEYSEKHGFLPYDWQALILDRKVRGYLLAARVPMMIGADPNDESSWAKYLLRYLSCMSEPLSGRLAGAAHMVIDSQPTLPRLLQSFELLLQDFEDRIRTSNESSCTAFNSRALVMDRFARCAPPVFVNRVRELLSLPPGASPSPSFVLNDLRTAGIAAINGLWEASIGDRTILSDAFPPCNRLGPIKPTAIDKADFSAKSSSKAFSKTSSSSLSSSKGASTKATFKSDGSTAAKAEGKSSVKTKSGERREHGCFNCLDDRAKPHPYSRCPKPCRHWLEQSKGIGRCEYGRRCVLGPKVPGEHGDDSRNGKPSSSSATAGAGAGAGASLTA